MAPVTERRHKVLLVLASVTPKYNILVTHTTTCVQPGKTMHYNYTKLR